MSGEGRQGRENKEGIGQEKKERGEGKVRGEIEEAEVRKQSTERGNTGRKRMYLLLTASKSKNCLR